jgi:glycosyltransferase involved in cell wall biosynthesis
MSANERRRILIVGMPDSIHIARWVQSTAELGWDVHLFPCYDAPAHQDLRDVTFYGDRSHAPDPGARNVRLVGMAPWAAPGLSEELLRRTPSVDRVLRVFWPSDAPLPRLRSDDRAAHLAHIATALRPHVLHSHEMQHSAYLTHEARRRLGGKLPVPWLVSDWGNDLYLFSRLPEHVEPIRDVLTHCDHYTAECARDAELAKKLGFRGRVLGIVPNGGGFDLARCRTLRQPGPTSARRTIALKGYDSWSGRALFGLNALRRCTDLLRGYTLAIYSAVESVRVAATLFAQETGIEVAIVPKTGHDEILSLHGRARISIALSVSDAACTSFLEALVMGSFPIQSRTACADEWSEHGRTSLLVDPEEPDEIAAAVRRALEDDALVDRAADENARTVEARLDREVVKRQIAAVYDAIPAGVHA